MQVTLTLLALCCAGTIATPVGQMFDPFGSFLQGEYLYNSSKSVPSFIDFTPFHSLFKTTLEDASQLDKLYDTFLGKFGKSNANEGEHQRRKGIFKNNLLQVFRHNIDAAAGKKSYTQHINQFADMTVDEIINGVTGYFPTDKHQNPTPQSNSTVIRPQTRKDSWIYDWRSVHVVTPVQNQGSCGACVYFAAAALIETAWARHGHGAIVLSPQQLNDCARDEARGNHGCQNGGGTFVPTFDYIKAHGLTSMQNYPYLARDANCDKAKEAQVVARISSWTPVTPHGDEEVLRKTIESHGPAAVAIHVSDGWARYKQGIFDEPCAGGRNHAVLAVGYGYDGASNKDYWIVKNQWGEGFGEGGYIRMRRNNNNMCDIAGDAVWVD